jgi:peptidoglycan/LPS O-acetylase OafA/YrhL
VGLLRILLAISVFCAHSRPLGSLRWLSGDLAVESFFVISGFYMQLILSTKYTKERLGNTWVWQFYKARYLRLLPVYWVGCLLALGSALIWPQLSPFPVWTYLQTLVNSPGNLLFKAYLGAC